MGGYRTFLVGVQSINIPTPFLSFPSLFILPSLNLPSPLIPIAPSSKLSSILSELLTFETANGTAYCYINERLILHIILHVGIINAQRNCACRSAGMLE
jgi:hypothetical protein